MENTGKGDDWHRALSARIGKAVADRRKALGMTAQRLSERCKELGAPIHRTTITKIENGRPRFDLGELLVLAAALNTSPLMLILSGPYNEKVELVPGREIVGFNAAQWISALEWLSALTIHDGRTYKHTALEARADWDASTGEIKLWRRLAELENSQSSVVLRGDLEQAALYDRMIQDIRRQLGLDDNA
jgi:transcriptional regulator with XRE-family HTH domain